MDKILLDDAMPPAQGFPEQQAKGLSGQAVWLTSRWIGAQEIAGRLVSGSHPGSERKAAGIKTSAAASSPFRVLFSRFTGKFGPTYCPKNNPENQNRRRNVLLKLFCFLETNGYRSTLCDTFRVKKTPKPPQ
jgi:hypothetical protein